MGNSCYDILIVGGGIVGASLAHALRDSGYRIAVLDSRPLAVAADRSDERTLALSFSSRRIFESMGLWAALSKSAAPIKSIHVSQRARFGSVRLRNTDYGVEALGYVVPNQRVEAHLHASLGAQDNLTLAAPVQFEQIRHTGQHVVVDYRDGDVTHSISASLLVVADGAQSALRDWLGIDVLKDDYSQTAIVSTVTLDRDHDAVAHERFTNEGPLALLPLADRRASLVWTHGREDAAARLEQSANDFLNALQSAFGFRLGRFVATGLRQGWPLSLLHARQVTGKRALLLGNAAHTLHPVAGQGFNLALRNIAVLSELLVAAAPGSDIGSDALLNNYANWTRDEVERVVGFTDVLARVFTNPLLPLTHARSMGLLATEFCGPLRNGLARRSMGMHGRLPRMACGLPLQFGQ